MAKLLVIEDDELVRTTIKWILERAGHEVFELNNGIGALSMHREIGIDAVVTDLDMPEQDGIETIIELKKEKQSLPIIAISGSGSNGERPYLKKAKNSGADYILSKPFRLHELLGHVGSSIES